MSWTRYLIHDFWTAREFNRRDAERRSSSRSTRRRLRRAAQREAEHAERIEQLEQDLGEVALLTRTLADLCIQKGLLTADEVAAMAERLDAADGTIDGRITPPDAPPPVG